MKALTLLCLSLPLLASCRATRGGPPEVPPEFQSIDVTLDALYAAFSFDAGEEADWATMRALFAPGASFVAPIAAGARPAGIDAEQFLADFRAWIASSEEGETGFHERILARRADVFGHIAQAWVMFEGFVPSTGEAKTRGIDSIQLVRAPEGWRVMSFTTQYEGEDAKLPSDYSIRRAPEPTDASE